MEHRSDKEEAPQGFAARPGGLALGFLMVWGCGWVRVRRGGRRGFGVGGGEAFLGGAVLRFN